MGNEYGEHGLSLAWRMYISSQCPCLGAGNLGVNFLSPGSRLHFVMSADNGLSWKLVRKAYFYRSTIKHCYCHANHLKKSTVFHSVQSIEHKLFKISWKYYNVFIRAHSEGKTAVLITGRR